MDVWHDGNPGKKIPEEFNAIIEIPKGSINKYEYDKDNQTYKLDRVLHSAVFYPADYGMIAKTLGEDGDPMDALVLVTQPTFPGCLIEARPIGVLKMIDGGEGDDKILAVPVEDPRFKDFKYLKDVPVYVKDEIANFFATYKLLEKKKVEITGWGDAKAAKKVLQESLDRYNEKFKK